MRTLNPNRGVAASVRSNGEIDAVHLPKPLVVLTTFLTLLGAIWTAIEQPVRALPGSAAAVMVAWFAISFLCTLLARRAFVPGFLGGLLFLLAGWRLAGPLDIAMVSWPAAITLALYVLQFLDAAITDRRRGANALMSLTQWQSTLIRIYFAFDMVPHFTEKLFAGPIPFHEDVAILTKYGLANAGLFVIVGGLCELGTAMGLGMGFLTRVAGAGAALYYLVTTMIGHHFSKGFIWNLGGGGWEYPMLVLVAFISFAFTGATRFSLDYTFARADWTPRFLQVLGLSPELRKRDV